MAEYRVELDAYSGPLDLLLFLVKRHEVDLHDIPIAKLTEQYLEHVEQLKKVDVDQLAEFLVMAALLLEIKSAMLSAGLAEPEDGDEHAIDTDRVAAELDPRFELVQQLLQYKRFKDAAEALHDRFDDWRRRYPCRPVNPAHLKARHDPEADDETAAEQQELDLEDANVMELADAYVRVLESVGQAPGDHRIVYDDTPIALYAEDIVDHLRRDGAMTLQDIFVGRGSRGEMVGLFLATLELVRNRRVRIAQDDADARIRLELCSADGEPLPMDGDAAAWAGGGAGDPSKVVYDWPTESLRRRAQQREKRRDAIKSHKEASAETSDPSDQEADKNDPEVDPVGAVSSVEPEATSP